ncbi:MAG: ATP-dependent DNA helicase RecG [Flavobacteriales bacterium]|nr:ATP-dependent DNA helicase RecG [Flavobacteriales bacterium]
MNADFLETPIEYLKGIGPQRGELLKNELGIFTFGDLLGHFPFRYIDRSKFYTIRELSSDTSYVQLKGVLTNINETGTGRARRLTALFKDPTGEIELAWFQNIKWFKQSLVPERLCILFGKPSFFNKKLNFVHPDIEWVREMDTPAGMQAVYSVTDKMRNQKMDSKALHRSVIYLFENSSLRVPEFLPENIRTQNRLPLRTDAFRYVHLPKNNTEIIAGQQRFKFEEFFLLNLKIARLKLKRKQEIKGYVFSKIGNNFNTFYSQKLPFELTDAQKRVMKEIRADMATGKQMNRLLQGDVGSGKTMVALLSMLIAIDNNTQAGLMAPTEILAQQHFESISTLLQGMGLRTELMTGSTRKKKRTEILEDLRSGIIDILIGTHALIEEDVQFKTPGLMIIDEQHRFGVEQRSKLWYGNSLAPHVLVMTATPIPRTLAMTVYGDLDVSKIDELPAGRVEIKTVHRYENARSDLFKFLKNEISKGRQVYYVYPLIIESEKLDYQNLLDGFHYLKSHFPEPGYKLGMVHGKMKASDKDLVMNAFKSGELNMLISTTVIEVGVNVPNASVMVIENSEKFGLSQLHQLRGRVGRGSEQSYCVLLSSVKLGKVARERLKAMVSTTDGFEIANLDLKLRGPGDITGTRQSGILDLKIADLVKDEDLLIKSRLEVERILKSDPDLSSPEHNDLKIWMKFQSKRTKDWGRVS